MPFRILDARSKPLAIANNRFPTRREAREAAAYLRVAAGYEGLRVKRVDGAAGFKRNGAPAHPPPPLALWRARRARALGATWTHPEAGWTATLTPARGGGGWRIAVTSPGRRPKVLFEVRTEGHPEDAYAELLGWAGVGDYAEAARRADASSAMRKFLRGQPLTAEDALDFWGARSRADVGRAADATEAALHAALHALLGGAAGLPPLSHVYGAANLSRLLRGRHGAEVGLPPPPDPAPRFGPGRRANGAAAAWAPLVGERVSGHDHPRLGRSWRRGVVAVGDGYVDVEGDPLDPRAAPVRVLRGGYHRSERKMNRPAESVTEFEPPRPGAAYHAVDAGDGRVFVRDGRNAVVAVGRFPPGTEAPRAGWLARWGVRP